MSSSLFIKKQERAGTREHPPKKQVEKMIQSFTGKYSNHTISIVAFDPEGPAIEMVITFPLDAPRNFWIKYPIGVYALRSRVARHGGCLMPAEYKRLGNMVEEFCKYIVEHHGWSRPYRHPQD
jgi:hypothetical protein